MKAENELRMLFSSNSSNSFREDPPNAVLVTQEGQCAYEITKLEVINNIVRMEMKALSDELENINGRMSLFIDNATSPLMVGMMGRRYNPTYSVVGAERLSGSGWGWDTVLYSERRQAAVAPVADPAFDADAPFADAPVVGGGWAADGSERRQAAAAPVADAF